MKIKCVTALFDINRDKLGDGRTIEEYLLWFEKTLSLKCDFVIYTEQKFKEFVENARSDSEFETEIIIQTLQDIPYYHKRNLIQTIIESEYYKKKMADLTRIECYLPEYNVIQFSKFGWLKKTIDERPDIDFIFWMDAGCSRFFGNYDMNQRWPNPENLKTDKLILQVNSSFDKIFPKLELDEYMWNNNSIVVGTLFGGRPDSVIYLHENFIKILEYCESRHCINNDQNALAIFVKNNIDRCNLFMRLDGSHLPLFRFLGEKK